ncbi:Plant invertase/pectin methylesterase inhibitor superfamily protein [Rhynchospora pubera]|uniref:Plant invertase/pectin methylesterase inhibitor superfamily protein n=1 Tax=Rhynchospora pubera TaxID=906938 RepID=A0AAV8C5P6_9POAL|nr:Plant invertase/pectin methylesterase inhibitor superfamily protein [Rhynchospora pubera]KAJ4796220.1 Plant invertase/pectin methylesterase inhibitor superfamily protein [Rhynchospora pubera]
MASIALFFSLLTSLLFTSSMAIASYNQNPTSFIRSSCGRTLYPGLCYASLRPFAARVGTDSVLLSRFAMNVSASRLKPLSDKIFSLHHRASLAPSSSGGIVTSAIKDCDGLISDASDLVKKSEKELAGLEEMVGREVTWRISNAQTWLSAAITDEGTCSDEFGNGGGEEFERVRKKVKRAEQLTSNALALVNCLVN